MRTTLGKLWFCLAFSSLLIGLPALSKAQATAATKTAASPSKKEKKSGKTAPASAVDLNNASQAELQSVPGIGAPTAKKIIAGRPYSAVGDLSKAGLSAKQIQGLGSMVKVGPASPSSTPASNVRNTPPTATAPTTPVQRRATPSPMSPAPSSPAATTPAPTSGPGMVWVNTDTKVFHRQGDKWYGKTKKGKYMKEDEAIKAGYHASKEKDQA